MSHNTRYAALVGDVIASRHAGDREQLQQVLEMTMATVNRALDPIQPVTMTIGDEFQGLFPSVVEAVEASLRIGLALKQTVETRIGIGWGELELVTETPPFGQDGPCWWLAREAIGSVKKVESSNSVPRSIRTLVRTGDDEESLLNSYLVARDHILSGWDETDVTIARLVLDGVNQAGVAGEVGLSQSSVSRRLQSHGILAVLTYRPEPPR